MSRPMRIGLIAEGEAELGSSVPYIKPEAGGKPIDREQEGALHTLIRRELHRVGLPDCDFVQRHPSFKERGVKLRTGYSILEKKYLAEVVIAWKPDEVDMILIVVDADELLSERQRKLAMALTIIRDRHLDADEQPMSDRSAGGLAIKNFETWLLADTQTVSKVLGVELEPLEHLEDLSETKERMENAIAKSTYLAQASGNQRPLQIRWNLATQLDLAILKDRCPNGYGAFIRSLVKVATVVVEAIAPNTDKLC